MCRSSLVALRVHLRIPFVWYGLRTCGGGHMQHISGGIAYELWVIAASLEINVCFETVWPNSEGPNSPKVPARRARGVSYPRPSNVLSARSATPRLAGGENNSLSELQVFLQQKISGGKSGHCICGWHRFCSLSYCATQQSSVFSGASLQTAFRRRWVLLPLVILR